MTVHQTRERIEHAEHAEAHEKKRAALLILVLAVALAIVEMAGKEAQFASIADNIKASDIYAFYQAKTIRHTLLETALEGTTAFVLPPPDRAAQVQNQIGSWKSTLQRLESEPEKGEGRKELLERAKALEQLRDQEERRYHHFEYSAAGLQLAIVMASAAVITEVGLLEGVAAVLGALGVGIAVLGWLAPEILKL